MKRLLIGTAVCGMTFAAVIASVTTFSGGGTRKPAATAPAVQQPMSANEKGMKRITEARAALAEALENLRLAQEQGRDVEAIRTLRARATQRRNALRKAYEASVGDFLYDSERNVADGCYNLGMCYLYGNGVLRDEQKAMKLFERAVETDHDHAAALNQLGECLRDGIGCAKDVEESVRRFARSAELGDANGELNYGLALIAQGTAEKDGDVAAVTNGMAHLKRAAVKRLPEAMNRYAQCLMDGTGFVPRVANPLLDESEQAIAELNAAEVSRREHEAVAWWYHCATDFQYPAAMVSLANSFRDGKGVEPRPRAAVYWYYRAAMDYDDVAAMWEMARCCDEGVGGLDYYGGASQRHYNANWWRTRAKATEGDRLAKIWLAGHDPHLFDRLNLLPAKD